MGGREFKKQLKVRGEDGKGAVNGRERWGKGGGRVEDVRGEGFGRGILVW